MLVATLKAAMDCTIDDEENMTADVENRCISKTDVENAEYLVVDGVKMRNIPVADGVIEGLKSAREWGSRSAMERLSTDQILELTELLSRKKESRRLELPTELIEHLQKNFIDFLGKTPNFAFEQILEKYQQSVISN